MSFETTTDEVLEGVDLHGKVAIVTGASTGLGARDRTRARVGRCARGVRRVATPAASKPPPPRSASGYPTRSSSTAILDLTSLDSVRGVRRLVRGHATTGCTC